MDVVRDVDVQMICVAGASVFLTAATSSNCWRGIVVQQQGMGVEVHTEIRSTHARTTLVHSVARRSWSSRTHATPVVRLTNIGACDPQAVCDYIL